MLHSNPNPNPDSNIQGEYLLKRDEQELEVKGDNEIQGLTTVRPSRITYFMYVGYRAIPFCFEMRSVLDWCMIPTSLDIVEWLKLADIHSSLFAVTLALTLALIGHFSLFAITWGWIRTLHTPLFHGCYNEGQS